MKKIQIIILIAAGVFSFAGAFGVTWFVKKSQPVIPETAIDQTQTGEGELTSEMGEFEPSGELAQSRIPTGDDELVRSMTERQLQSLINAIREQMKEYKFKEKELVLQENRLQTAQETLGQDVERLNSLREDLATTLSRLKDTEYNLQQRILEISAIEKTNMQSIANRYDQMETKQAAAIMINMNNNNQLDDVVKIVYYMSDRKSAKLLGEIGKNEISLAAALSVKLKQIKESE